MLTPVQWVRVFEANVRPEHRTFLFLGGPADRSHAQGIIDILQPLYATRSFENRCGSSSLRQSTTSVFASEEFWGIDSSLLHLARVAGVRCVSYWGPTDPSTRLRQTWAVDEQIHYRKIACSPCVHTSEEPPCRGDNRCIHGLFDEADAADGWTPVEYPRHRRGSKKAS
jgi:ADP-heptose:LPS heptosyltransferase